MRRRAESCKRGRTDELQSECNLNCRILLKSANFADSRSLRGRQNCRKWCRNETSTDGERKHCINRNRTLFTFDVLTLSLR